MLGLTTTPASAVRIAAALANPLPVSAASARSITLARLASTPAAARSTFAPGPGSSWPVSMVTMVAATAARSSAALGSTQSRAVLALRCAGRPLAAARRRIGAIPKSSSRTPRAVSSTLLGWMSPCTRSFLCACASSSSTASTTRITSVGREDAAPRRRARGHRLALEERHHHEGLGPVLAVLEDADRPRVAHPVRQARPVEEAVARVGQHGHVGVQHPQGASGPVRAHAGVHGGDRADAQHALQRKRAQAAAEPPLGQGEEHVVADGHGDRGAHGSCFGAGGEPPSSQTAPIEAPPAGIDGLAGRAGAALASAAMAWPIRFEDVIAAEARLRPHLSPTPLRGYAPLDAAVGHGVRVLVKHENHLPTNAFKVRNGLSVLTALGDAERGRGVVAATRGNHGLGLAWSGARLGVRVTICVPVGNNPEKNEAVRGLGAALVEEGQDYDEAVTVAERLVAERGLTMVHSTNEPLVLAGAGTLALEMLRERPDLTALVIADGGGSQAVGALTVVRELLPAVPVYAVQAERAAAIHDAWHSGVARPTASADTFADGLATRNVYALTFPALREGLAGFVTVSEAEIAGAIRLLVRTTHNLAEGAGAAGLAGLCKLAPVLSGRLVGVVLSGGNLDLETLRRVTTGEL